MNLEELKYPIGRFEPKEDYTSDDLQTYREIIRTFPTRLESAIAPLSPEQLGTAYRPGGWTLIQVVNHCADSHMHALIRVKFALTEDLPTIKPYLQDLWVTLPDGSLPPESALSILKGVHDKWWRLLSALSPEQWERQYIHPEKGKSLSLKEVSASYAWHCDHHLAHITRLKARMGW